METKEFLEQFVVTGDMVEADMEEIYFRAVEENEALKKLVERAFKLGVAEGLASAEYAITRVLKIKIDDVDTCRDPALRTVMKMSERCYRAIKEQPEEPAHNHRNGESRENRSTTDGHGGGNGKREINHEIHKIHEKTC
jgi:hypothetical protein